MKTNKAPAITQLATLPPCPHAPDTSNQRKSHGWPAGEAHIPVTSSSGVTHGGPAATLTRGRPAGPTLTIIAERVP